MLVATCDVSLAIILFVIHVMYAMHCVHVWSATVKYHDSVMSWNELAADIKDEGRATQSSISTLVEYSKTSNEVLSFYLNLLSFFYIP